MISRRLPRQSFTLYCVRHGESVGNARAQGLEADSDSSLSMRGKQQVRSLALALPKRITHAGSSDLARAQETLNILRQYSILQRAHLLEPSTLLRELSRGNDASSGYPSELQQLMNVVGATHYRSPDGDSMADIATNYLNWVMSTIISIEDGAQDAPIPSPHVLMVAHGNGIKALWSAVTLSDPSRLGELRNASVTTIAYDPERLKVHRSPWIGHGYGEVPHA